MATDASLRQGMGRIRDAMEEPMPAIYAGKADSTQFEIRAKRVNEQIASWCRLQAGQGN